MKKKRAIYLIVVWALVMLWASMIARFSAQDGFQSEVISMEVTDVVVALQTGGEPVDRTTPHYIQMHHRVRKLAHASEYALLALLIMAALASTRIRVSRALLLVLALCACYALIDEWHQGFSAGRTPALKDVLIDTAGAAGGCLIALFCRQIIVSVGQTGPFWRRLKSTG